MGQVVLMRSSWSSSSYGVAHQFPNNKVVVRVISVVNSAPELEMTDFTLEMLGTQYTSDIARKLANFTNFALAPVDVA